MAILALALAPILFAFTFVYLKDEYEREPLHHLVITFVLGILTAFPVIYFGDLLSHWTGTTSKSGGFSLIIYALVVVALVEEMMKYLVVRLFNYNRKEFDEPYDGIMYCVAASLGFAALENILYVAQAEDHLSVGLLRMFTAVPAHGIFGTIMGYYVGRGKFMVSRSAATWEHIKGVGFAIIFHGLYDYFLFADIGGLAILSFFLLALNAYIAIRAIKIHRARSPHQFKEDPNQMVSVEDDTPPIHEDDNPFRVG